MEIIKDIPQRSSEWFELRAGKMSASNAHVIATAGAGLETYCYNLIAKYYSNTVKENITNADIERGIENEYIARELYMAQTGYNVEEITTAILNDYVCVSPDGVIYQNGDIIRSIEIKCPRDDKYIKVLCENYIEPNYKWQMQLQMYVLDTCYVDYVVYNPHFDKDLIIIPYARDEEMIEKLKIGLKKGTEILKELHSTIQKIRSL